jgi:hypothetical protein
MFLPQSDSTDKIKLIAIAKDECAYLPEWIFHHLYFGFDYIQILVNRTSDNTDAMLTRLVKKHPQVTWNKVDYLDWIPGNVHKKLQHIAYASAIDKTLTEESDVTHVMFLDIDEFWIEKSFKKTVIEFLSDIESNSAISFNWLIDTPSPSPFETIPQTLSGIRNTHVKSLFPLSRKIKKIRLHRPLLVPNHYLMPNGVPFKPQADNDELSREIETSQCFIYHRVYRSEFEYISTLYRGQPGRSEAPFKMNRSGIHSASLNEFTYTIPEENYKKYIESQAEFLSSIKWGEFKRDEQQFVASRYEQCILGLKHFLPSEPKKIMSLFRNVSDQKVYDVMVEYIDNELKLRKGNAEAIRDLALDVENFSVSEAKKVMLQAKILRPNGRVINQKLVDYDKETFR